MRLPPYGWHVSVWLLLGSIIAVYFIALSRHRRRTGEQPAMRRTVAFLAGMGVLWIGADWPIHDLAEGYLYSVHMVQHLLFTLVAPPLLIAGMPAWLLREGLSRRPVDSVFRFFTRPLIALVVFNGLLVFTHWPEIVALSIHSEIAHFCLHLVLVAAALCMWWPVMSHLPEFPPLSAPGQMVYLFLQSLVPTIPASFLVFGRSPLYPVYVSLPRIWGIDALTDQLIAGLIMKLIGGLILWGFIAVIFFRWYARERRDEGWDPTRYAGMEREITSGARR